MFKTSIFSAADSHLATSDAAATFPFVQVTWLLSATQVAGAQAAVDNYWNDPLDELPLRQRGG